MGRRWIGGSVCAGKTTIARLLASGGVESYHFDAHERDHLLRLGRGNAIYEDLPTDVARGKHDERWLHRTPDEMAERTERSWADRFPLVLEDLGCVSVPVIVEGAGLFPELVRPELSTMRHGVWLVATPEFIRRTRSDRGMVSPSRTSDPARAAENIIARDTIMAAKIEASAIAMELRVIAIDGSRSLTEIAGLVAEHFGADGS